jgi:hypothetical protein
VPVAAIFLLRVFRAPQVACVEFSATLVQGIDSIECFDVQRIKTVPVSAPAAASKRKTARKDLVGQAPKRETLPPKTWWVCFLEIF